ncbi:MAG: hypothetical protein KGR98_07900 [Verrucomicrobia bacterium]|nr:hypothetical protein [Verrucomicrobiota bacterium]MDE3098464.1 hypothetical protein [Verrucomicrobiota bacterium]
MIGELLFWSLAFLFHSIILLALLWIMIKLQKFEYNWPGLIGSAFLAGGLDLIPYAGHFAAVILLYLCIWKMTQTTLFPDAAFTVFIAYALMFCVNLFLLGAMLGDLRPDLHPADNGDTVRRPVPAMPAHPLVAAAVPSDARPPKAATNALPPKPGALIVKNFSVKSLISNGSNSLLVLDTGAETYTLAMGEQMTMRTPTGTGMVRFDGFGTNSVTLDVDGQTLKITNSLN